MLSHLHCTKRTLALALRASAVPRGAVQVLRGTLRCAKGTKQSFKTPQLANEMNEPVSHRMTLQDKKSPFSFESGDFDFQLRQLVAAVTAELGAG